MRLFKTIILLFLGFLIFGSAGYFGYELFVKPGRIEKNDRKAKASAPAATPTPDPGAPEFDRLKKLQESGKTTESREGLKSWIDAHPDSPLAVEARRLLGSANMTLLFQQADSGGQCVMYTVVKGDSLARIAAKHKSNAELIQTANSLPSINLQIGQQLIIPSLDVSLEINREAKTLTTLDHGGYLKEYLLLSAPASPKKAETIKSKVLDKVTSSGGKRVAFGDKTYAESERVILLTQAPPIVSPPPQAPITDATKESPTTPSASPQLKPAMPGGYVLSSDDLRELFPLVSRNTPVIIH